MGLEEEFFLLNFSNEDSSFVNLKNACSAYWKAEHEARRCAECVEDGEVVDEATLISSIVASRVAGQFLIDYAAACKLDVGLPDVTKGTSDEYFRHLKSLG